MSHVISMTDQWWLKERPRHCDMCESLLWRDGKGTTWGQDSGMSENSKEFHGSQTMKSFRGRSSVPSRIGGCHTTFSFTVTDSVTVRRTRQTVTTLFTLSLDVLLDSETSPPASPILDDSVTVKSNQWKYQYHQLSPADIQSWAHWRRRRETTGHWTSSVEMWWGRSQKRETRASSRRGIWGNGSQTWVGWDEEQESEVGRWISQSVTTTTRWM
jgi:hypothetical protein